MEFLDGDNGVLKSVTGEPATRDIVQFVPFSSKMYIVFKFRRVLVPGCMHPKNDHGLDKAASCSSEGMPVLLVPSESWDAGFCVQSCVLLSCSSLEPSLYNLFHILSLGYCRVKGDVLCPGIRTLGKELRSYCWSLLLRPIVIEVELSLPCCWKQSSHSSAPPTSTVGIGIHALCMVSWAEWFKWKPKIRDIASGWGSFSLRLGPYKGYVSLKLRWEQVVFVSSAHWDWLEALLKLQQAVLKTEWAGRVFRIL